MKIKNLDYWLYYGFDLKRDSIICIRDNLTIKYFGYACSVPEHLLSHDVLEIRYNCLTEELTFYIRG